jgi:hypothetical protein
MIDEERALFTAVYDRFAEHCTVTLMARIIHERAFSAKAIDALFERESERQYTREILFSSLVGSSPPKGRCNPVPHPDRS